MSLRSVRGGRCARDDRGVRAALACGPGFGRPGPRGSRRDRVVRGVDDRRGGGRGGAIEHSADRRGARCRSPADRFVRVRRTALCAPFAPFGSSGSSDSSDRTASRRGRGRSRWYGRSWRTRRPLPFVASALTFAPSPTRFPYGPFPYRAPAAGLRPPGSRTPGSSRELVAGSLTYAAVARWPPWPPRPWRPSRVRPRARRAPRSAADVLRGAAARRTATPSWRRRPG